jgi:hypothetical protein
MKRLTKSLLRKFGVWHSASLIRSTPAIISWLRHGCVGNAPLPLKRMAILHYMRRFKISHLVETGTHLGETVDFISSMKGYSVTSIELDDSLYHNACKRFQGRKNIKLIHGDSGTELPKICRQLDEPAVFWLDGHFSGNNTAKGIYETPIMAELNAITGTPDNHVVLVDDARCFTSQNDYPALEEFLSAARSSGRFAEIEVTADIIRLTPKQTRTL